MYENQSNAEEGECALCQQRMLRSGTDAWHPWNVEKACPPENEHGFPRWGTPGRPGVEHFRLLVSETQGQREFRQSLFNALTGRCVRATCGRKANKQGKWCCRMCRELYGTHSKLCRRNNE